MEVLTKAFSFPKKITNFICILICIVLTVLLTSNIAIIVKGYLHPEEPPTVFGITPMVVLSGSMSGTIEVGDLIFTDKAEINDIVVGDIISFMVGKTVVTHRVVEITTNEDGKLAFVTQGDNNSIPDYDLVTADNFIGIYKTRIPYIGDFALFLQTPLGMVIFIGIPLLAFIAYDTIRREKQAKKEEKKTAELEAEIERLKQMNGDKIDN